MPVNASQIHQFWVNGLWRIKQNLIQLMFLLVKDRYIVIAELSIDKKTLDLSLAMRDD